MLSICRCAGLRTSSRTRQGRLEIFTSQFRSLSGYPTAGIIVIGDEILKGRVKDTNSYFMCTLLYDCGVKVKKISVITDNVENIEKEIREFSKKYTHVITSGGIGPTHDDVTYEGLSKAFDDSLHYHPTLVDIIRNRFGCHDLSSPSYKMAYIPTRASLKFGINESTGEPLPYPSINIGNVHVFPGSPAFFEKSFKSLCKELFSANRTFVKEELYINSKEEAFANALTVVSKEYSDVSFGSYPVVGCSYYKAFVTIESDSEETTRKAKERFRELAPPNIFVEYDPAPYADCVKKYDNFRENRQDTAIFDATLERIEEIFQDPGTVAICFDGSAESTVVLHLAHIACTRSNASDRIQAVYFKCIETLSDVELFIGDITRRYNVNLCTLNAEPRGTVEQLRLLKPRLSTLLIGTRASDSKEGPFQSLSRSGKLGELSVTCPLIDWTADDVWTFARSLSLPHYPP